ncbi:hypothetical protein F5J12DRAFT_445043 [Pisolithus orientalis]|uniref:uncharacterized protein n=1 Tax=Pisolithus orientalis TaxID=936130 RepID=UPI0022254DD0|nr:uncharacterized protein F5J12DRAFT_445043 [Pisolithus orientalis]KAI6025703.1 hypothetical protein F5J12DRAFT_445043 [Pisolithus orientalis]
MQTPNERPTQLDRATTAEILASDWEDLSDSESTPEQARSSNASIGSNTPRKRRRGAKHAAGATTTRPPKSPAAKPKRQRAPIIDKEELEDAIAAGARFSVQYVLDVVSVAIKYMRWPLSIFLCLWMLALLISRMTNVFRTALYPLCFIPGMSRTALCVPVPLTPPQHPDFPGLVKAQGSMFDQLVGESVGGSALSIEVLKAEMATRDLSTLVRYSDLKSRESVADLLSTISIDAKRTARGLTKLNAKVAGAVDEVMALNSYAMATIEEAHEKAPSPILQAIIPIKIGPTADEIIQEVSGQNLDQMEVDIASLHDMITREDKHMSTEKDRVLGELWSRLGGNKQKLREYDDRLALLNDLAVYRKQARAHVMAALQTLHAMSDDLEDLRERVAAPGIIGGKLPVRVHIESIKNGLERLKEGRTRAREVGNETSKRLLGSD